MNNEVLRRKMFRKVLADSRSPAGILASSPEMVETVQRRANGGMQTDDYEMRLIPKLAAEGNVKALESIATGTGYSTKVRNAARDAVGSLITKVNTAAPSVTSSIPSATPSMGMPDESSGMAISGEEPTGGAGFGIPFLLEKIFRAGEIARPKGMNDPDLDPILQQPKVRNPFTPGPLENRNDIYPQEDQQRGPLENSVYPQSDQLQPLPGVGETLAGKTAPSTSADTTDADAKDKTKTEIGKSSSRAKLESLLENINKGEKPKAKLNADEAARPEAAEALSIVLPEEVSLSEMEKEAKRIMGFDPSKAKEDKKDAFWRNLTMAGLAMAAGESDNALTNVAKGLMVGLDSYSKDVKELSAQEAEERKEYRATLRSLIKDKRDENIAMAGLQNDFNYKVADLNLRKDQFATSQAFEKEKLGLQMSLAGKQLEVSIASSLADLDIKQQTLDETTRQNIITNQQNWLIKQPEFVQNAVALGYAEVDAEGKTTWTDEGKTWLAENVDLILRSSLTSSKSTTGQAFSPERFAQEVLKTQEGRDSISDEMISLFPDQFNSTDKRPTLDDMQNYVANAGVSSSTQQAQQQSTDAARITTQQEFDALPSGSKYIDPGDNKIYIKP